MPDVKIGQLWKSVYADDLFVRVLGLAEDPVRVQVVVERSVQGFLDGHTSWFYTDKFRNFRLVDETPDWEV